jgi:biotin carboxyl carrier protein
MKLKITVHGVAYEVDVEVLDAGEGFPNHSGDHRSRPRVQSSAANGSTVAPPPPAAAPKPTGNGQSSGSITSPIAGQIIEIKCKPGDPVKENQIVLVIEAMKMKTSIAAPTPGKIKSIPVAVGDSVQESQTLVVFE